MADVRSIETERAAHFPRIGPASTVLPAIGALVLVVLLGAKAGGYFPTVWGGTGIALAWTAAVVLLLKRSIRLSSLELVAVGALTAFVAWVAVSYVWSDAPGHAVGEVQRDLLYPLGLFLALIAVRSSGIPALLGALAAGITGVAMYGLATRLFPESLSTFDSIGGYRLSEPVGYWNALGILTAAGVVLALGFAARGGLVTRLVAACVLVFLLPTLYFTFSRGAFIALGIALAVAFALDTNRLQLAVTALAVAPGPALAAWLASRSDALTRIGAPVDEATRQGHRLGALLLAIAAAAMVSTALLVFAERKWRPGRTVRNAWAAVLVAAVVAAVAVVLVRFDGPVNATRDAYNAFRSHPVDTGANLNTRLFNLNGSGRTILWGEAWDQYTADPVLGAGPGSFEEYWHQHRPIPSAVRDAHNLYLEVLAELGPIGFLLLLLAVLSPLVAAARARGQPSVAFAAAAYVAVFVHAGVDWDWEMPVVLLTGLLCGAALLVAARPSDDVVRRQNALHYGALAATILAGAVALVGFIGSSAYETARAANSDGRLAAAERQARKSADWQPWAAEPLMLLAEVQEKRGDLAGALRSLRKAVKKEPHDFDAWYELARIAKGAEHRRALERARRLNPLSPVFRPAG